MTRSLGRISGLFGKVVPNRVLALLLLALICTCCQAASLMSVHVLDVGQGDSILVDLPNGQHMLVDAGDAAHGGTVAKYLAGRKIKKIDILVATHPHADHIGGMPDILSRFTVGKVWDSGFNSGSATQARFYSLIKQKAIRFGKPKAGFSEKIGDVTISVLAPVRPLTGTDSDANNNSIVLRLSYGATSFLLTGDMETEERATVGTWPKSTVLKVSHHGSRNGTDSAFLRAVSPMYAAISVGAGNSYGHPHPEALSALKSANVKVYRTDQSGTVVFTSDGKSVNVRTLGRSAATTSSSSGLYIGNKRSRIFHRPTCSTLPKPENRVYFKSRQEAINAGYRPCKRCKP